jgi:SpoVK/Ycf46/Vps4 family AAA+-type ATPase
MTNQEAGAALPIVALLREEAQFATGVHVLDHGLVERAADTIEELVEVLAKVRERFEWAGHEGEQPGCPACDLFNEVRALLAKLEGDA